MKTDTDPAPFDPQTLTDLRLRLWLRQEDFAVRYQIPYTTVRDWEQGRRQPDAAARAYLRVIDRDPDHIAALLT
ncbi:DNA-binding transcriptional regulator YiaG [Skermanella aerolata]|uniref:helix-turn-helix domain-containing protein n=1 Tax=Skermanella aerolata TaxID=393310 RepID=UPI003D254C92